MRFGTMFKNWVKSEESKEIKSERTPFVIEQKIKDMYEKLEYIRQNTPHCSSNNIWEDIFAATLLPGHGWKYFIFKDTDYGNRCLACYSNYIIYYQLREGREKYDNSKSQKPLEDFVYIEQNYKPMFTIEINSISDEVQINVAEDTNMNAVEIDLAIYEMRQHLNTKFMEVRRYNGHIFNNPNELTEYFSARVN